MRKVLIVISVLAIAVLLSGCTCCNFSKGTSTNTFTLNSRSYEYKDISLGKGKALTYSVSSTKAPVSVYVLDESNYNLLKGDSKDWTALLKKTANLETSGTFTATEDGTYYFVVENPGSKSTSVTWDLSW